jgi:hypothetical protein
MNTGNVQEQHKNNKHKDMRNEKRHGSDRRHVEVSTQPYIDRWW